MRDAEQNRACAEQGDARNCIKNYCFRTLIFKLVNPLKSLEDISLYMNRFLRATPSLFIFSSSLKQRSMASQFSQGWVFSGFVMSRTHCSPYEPFL